MQSALVLAPSGDRDQQADDGWLQAHEVFDRVRLKAELVVLSGCSTGTGRLARGEGLLGLTRGFLFGGARSVVATLWPVADRSTTLLMEQFYRGLIEGKNKARALRDAQAWLASQPQYSHPYFWAGFELIGDDRPIDRVWPGPARVGSGPVAVVTGVLVLSGLVGWRSWRRRTRATG
jgi:CHAT domain-containing protein